MHTDSPRLLALALGFGVLASACVAKEDGGLLVQGTGGKEEGTGTGGTPSGPGGASGTGGAPGPGGAPGTGGNGTGGVQGSGTGGKYGTGGSGVGAGGAKGTGGAIVVRGTGGATTSDGGVVTSDGSVVDPCSVTTPLTGGTVHTSSNASGTAAGLNWTIWSNSTAGSITTYTVPAFSADWNNSGDYLARLGLQWNQTKTYDQYGTISAQFNYTKSGSGGGYSYIGIYGWSVNPCVEFYIVDDSFNKMPVNPGNTTNKGTVDIDGGSYILYSRPTTGTGGSKCSGVSSWTQYYSVRKTARQCGVISITDHFNAWAAAGMPLGKMDQAQILVEVGGGSGSADFTVANVTTQ